MTVNKIFVIIDIELEKLFGLNKAIALKKFYTNSGAPNKKCAIMNQVTGYIKYAVAELSFTEVKRKSYVTANNGINIKEID